MRTVKDPATRREEIMNAAVQLFSQEGYPSTTVEDIVLRAGIAKGSFYNYFKSKEEVSEAIIDSMADQIVMGAGALLNAPNRTPKQRLKDFVTFTLQTGVEQDMGVSQFAASANNPSIKTMYLRAADSGARLLVPVLCQTLEEGQRLGEFSMVDAQFTAAFIVGAFQRLYSTFFEGKSVDLQTVRRNVNDFMGRLLGTDFQA